MCKFCWALALVLLGVVLFGGYKFIFEGSVEEAGDGRMAIHVTLGERDLVLAEMRAFLKSVQAITEAVGREDLPAIVTAARAVGRAAQVDVPAALMGKLPLAFKKLGLDTHQRFDQLALDAEQLGDSSHALQQLAELMNNCVACHAGHRFMVTE